MASILFTWELGGGLGHLMRIYPILKELQSRGHRITAALRDQRHVALAWPGLELPVYPAPHKAQPTAHEIHPVKFYSDILHNIGWSNIAELEPLLAGWQELYQQVRPDFVIHDHSPTAMLVSQQFAVKHALIGTGFCSPPDTDRAPLLRTWSESSPTEEVNVSTQILKCVNPWLLKTNQPLISRPTEPYSRAHENFLTTFQELDHFGPRPNATYWGIPNDSQGTRPAWPPAAGPKLFAYLHADATLPGVINAIRNFKLPTMIFLGSRGQEQLNGFANDYIHITSELVDLAWVAQEAAVGILNGSHGSTAAFLLAGKPILQLPIQLEQYLGAKRSVDFGAALMADRHQPDTIEPQLKRLLREVSFTANAFQFSDRYRSWTPQNQTNRIVERIEKLLPGTPHK
jgi:hypothetical protein